MDTGDFPQANRLENVYLAIKAIASGFTSGIEIERAINMESGGRQGRYHRDAAIALGFATNSHNFAQLTTSGAALLSTLTHQETVERFREGVLACKPLALLLSQINSSWVSTSNLEAYYMGIYPDASSPSTSERRFSTARNYLVAVGIVEEGPHGLRRPPEAGSGSLNPVRIGPVNWANPGQVPTTITPGIAKYLQIDVDMQKHDRANLIHQELVSKKSAALAAAGISSSSTNHIDLIAFHEGAAVIYEMKSTSEDSANLLTQIRKAVAQLHEYRYLSDIDATLCIVTDAPLSGHTAWLSKYLSFDRGIAYIWLDEHLNFHSDIDSDGLLEDWM